MARIRAYCNGAGPAEEVTRMALLDIQALEPAEGGHRGGGGSDLSLLLCDSTVSITLC